jgi:fatty acid-binding protein DegV
VKHTFTVKVGKLGEYEKSLPKRYAAALLRAHDLAAKEMTLKLQAETRNAAPTHSGGPVGAVATGKAAARLGIQAHSQQHVCDCLQHSA